MDTKTDTPLTLATIQAFRRMLDVMEDFIKNTEAEHLEEIEKPKQTTGINNRK